MYPFTLERPTTLAAAAQLTADGAKPLAGGQSARILEAEHRTYPDALRKALAQVP